MLRQRALREGEGRIWRPESEALTFVVSCCLPQFLPSLSARRSALLIASCLADAGPSTIWSACAASATIPSFWLLRKGRKEGRIQAGLP